MAVDDAGGVWAGAMHKGLLATRGVIYHAASLADRPIEVAAGLGVPNGMAFSAERGTLYVIDTLSRTLLAYPVIDHGLGEPVIITDFMGVPGKPDGMTIGDDGSLWVAMWGGGCVVRIAAAGHTLQLVDIPAPHVSSLCLADEAILFVTTSRMRLSPEALDQHPASGGLFRIDLGDIS
jgi:sugar lactone lactonase YvrE